MMNLEVIGWLCSVPEIALNLSTHTAVDLRLMQDCYSFLAPIMLITQYHCRNHCLMHVDFIVCTFCYIEHVDIRPHQLLNCYDVLIVTMLLKNMCIHVISQYLCSM